MRHQLTFTELINYDAGQPSITVPVTLSVGQTRIDCNAKIDTGSSNCIFARSVGEELGLDIETGLRLLVGTVTGNFVAYLHEVNPTSFTQPNAQMCYKRILNSEKFS